MDELASGYTLIEGPTWFAPDGALIRRIDTVHMPTSVCFGGADLRELYIVSGSEGTGREDGGSVFRMQVDVPGLPVAAARVDTPSRVKISLTCQLALRSA